MNDKHISTIKYAIGELEKAIELAVEKEDYEAAAEMKIIKEKLENGEGKVLMEGVNKVIEQKLK